MLRILLSMLVGSCELHDLEGDHRHKAWQPLTMGGRDFTDLL